MSITKSLKREEREELVTHSKNGKIKYFLDRCLVQNKWC